MSPGYVRKTEEASYLVSAPREHRKWHGDRNVDSDLTDVHVMFKLPCSRARLRKDCSAIAITVLVDDLDTLI